MSEEPPITGAQKLIDAMTPVTNSTSRKRLRPNGPMWTFLQRESLKFAALKAAPAKPPATPMSPKMASSQTRYALGANLPNSTGTSVPRTPNGALWCMGPRKKRTVKAEAAAQTKQRVRIVGFMCVAPSSTAKSTPPMGAPNAAATPAAAPAAVRSRASRFWRYGPTRGPASARAMSAPTMAPLWIMGPSFPHGSPAATLKTMPAALHRRVRPRSTPGMSTPFR
mmetsp:Transcript_92478/g.288274  ORF Transcript_92478/g.288274 Transcript_92478/m.288274 type:complete len:224 (-) Transcript_92478:384-1055(-)